MTIPEVEQLMTNYFNAFDNGDINFYNYFNSDVVLYFGNQSPIFGLEKLKTTFNEIRFNNAFKITHKPQIFLHSQINESSFSVASDIIIDYDLNDGTKISLPCASITKFLDSKISEIKIFIDANPLYSALSA